MTLLEMSPNVQEPNPARKRSHEEFSGDEGGEDTPMEDKTPSKRDVRSTGDSLPPPVSNKVIASSPQGSPALTEAGSSTAACNSPSPETPTKAGTAQAANTTQTSNPAKRKKLTPAEKEAREKEAADKKEQKEREAAQRKKERDEKAALKAAEKAKQDEEKAARQREKDEKRKKKEEEEKLKAEQREEKKKQKEEEEKRIQEEKEKKARSQPSLTRMGFIVKPSTPNKVAPTMVCKSSPAKGATDMPDGEDTETPYDKMFQPFYLKEHTRMAPDSCNMDEETRELKSKILDECIAGKRKVDVAFDPASLFALPGATKPRGKQHHPVRHIMESVYREMERLGTTASADILQAARKKLVGIPVKVIAFSQDVRPPYYGTITYRPFALGQGNMRKVARRSASRRLQLDYDYDSEAEWQEEEGEDLDADDDDEEMDEEDDMDGFLDDTEDSGLTRRTFGNTMEPESTGVCFENENRKAPKLAASDNKMEMILDTFYKNASIDPFATSYWEPEPKPTVKAAPTKNTTEKMAPPPAPTNAFAALNCGTDSAPVKLVKADLMNNVKKAILQNKALSKLGIVDYIFQQYRGSVSRVEVKNTLELVAEKKGTGKMKQWDLKPGHEISLQE